MILVLTDTAIKAVCIAKVVSVFCLNLCEQIPVL